jgi:signal transduction histidine kinase
MFASKSYSVTGLGLFIAKSIIESNYGKIWVENNSEGRGATFSSVSRSEVNDKQSPSKSQNKAYGEMVRL